MPQAERRTRALQASSTAANILASSSAFQAASVSSFLGGAGAGSTLTASPFLTSAVPVVALIPPLIGLSLHFNRQRFPQIRLDQIATQLREAERLRKQGLQPQLVNDPFTGALAIGTADQDIELLLRERAVREASRPAPGETNVLSQLRGALIDASKETAVERGFFPSLAAVPDTTGRRCGVFRETADSPIQFRCF